jgi:hypothetical protein
VHSHKIAARSQAVGSGQQLSAFGIVPPSIETAVVNQTTTNKDAILKCAYIRGPTNNVIVFRCQPVLPGTQCWCEKLWFDAVKGRHPWILDLGINDRTLSWYHENEPMLNEKGYAVRIFMIVTPGPLPTKDRLLSLGEHICRHINLIPGNTTKMSIEDESNYFWLGEDAVWHRAEQSFGLRISRTTA